MWRKIILAKVPIVGIGLVAGIVSSMFGVGGGIILVPMLIFLLNFDIHQAVGTSLLIIIPTVLVGAYAHYRLGNVNIVVALVVIVGAVIGCMDWCTYCRADTISLFGKSFWGVIADNINENDIW